MNQAFSPGRRDSPLAYRLSSSPAPSTSPSLPSDSVFEHHYDRSAAGTPLGYATTQPPQPSSRKNSVSGEQRADQIIREVYSKVAQVVAQARVTGVQPAAHARKPNKWFNLETNDIEGLKEQLKFWKANATTTPQPLLIDVYLDISSLSRGQTLMLRDEQTMRRQRMSHESLYTVEGQGQSEHGAPGRYNSVLLESWQLTFSHSTPTQPPELPTVYKKSVAFFRSLYSHVRLLPAYRLSRRFRRKQSGMGVGYRVSTSRVAPYDEAGLDQLHSSGDMRRGIEEYNFGSIETPLGVFSLHVNYRLECDFSIDDPDLAVLDGRLADMDENYFSPRSLGAMRERELNNGSPLVSQQAAARRDSMSSQRGMPYDNEDLRRTSIGHGSLPRRLKTTHGSTMSIHSQDSSQSAAGHGGGQHRHSPVNIPAGSLPARMTARTNSIGSNASSPAGGGGGVPTHPSAATGSASSRRLSNLQPSSNEKRSSWQSFSPAIQAATGPAFTPPSAGFSLGRPVANGWRQEQPPFCTTNMVDTQPAVNVQPQHHVPFDSQTPPFQVQSTSQSHYATDDPHSRIEHQQHPSSQASAALPLVRRASMTFATTGLREGQQAYTTIPVFTPSSSATGRPHLMGLEIPPLAMDPADRTAIAGAEPDHDAELGAFLRTLETNRRRLEMPVTASQQQRSGGDDDHVQQQQQQQPPLSGQQPHQQQKPSRTRMALARFQELHEMNNSFSESLSDMVASQHGEFPPPPPSQLQQQQHWSSPGRGKRESPSGNSTNHSHHHPQSTMSTTEPGIHILPPSSPPFSSPRFSDRRQEREHPHTQSDDGPHASRSVSPPPPQSSSSSPQHPSWRRDDLLLRETTPRSPPPPPPTASSRPSAPNRFSFSSDNVFISTSLPPAAVAAHHSAYPARETHSLAASRVYPQHNYSHNEQPSPRVFSERSNPDPRLHERYASDGHHDDSYHAQHHHHHHHPTAAKQRRASAGGAMTHHHHHHHPHQHHQTRPHHPHDAQRRHTDTAILEEQPGRRPLGGLGAEYESLRQQQLQQQSISAATAAAAAGSASRFNMGLQLYDDTHQQQQQQQQQQQNPHHAHHYHRHHRSSHNPTADTTTTTTTTSSSRPQSRPSNHHHRDHHHHHDHDRLGDDDNQPPLLPAAAPHHNHNHHAYNDTDDDELLFEMSGLDILECRSVASSAGAGSASGRGRDRGAGSPLNPFLA